MRLAVLLPFAVVVVMSVSAAWAQVPAEPAEPPVEADDAAEPATWPPRTGDAWTDTWLVDVERYAERHPAAFVDELVRYRGAPRALVEQLMADPAWRPADVYTACAVAQALGRTCREVALAWQRDPAGGWGEVVERLDAERHRAAMARLKQGLVESYDRWARPIRLDAALRRALPDRAE